MKKLAPLSLLAALLLSPFASAQIVVIQGTDTVASSRGTINGNFAYLNTNKITDPTTTIGDMIYRSSGGLTRLPIGTNGQCITVAGGIPAWANSCGGGGGGTINSVNGTSNQITAVTTSGNVVLALPSGGIILPGNLTAPTGSTITYTGSGLINANQLYGVTLSGLSTGLMKITSGVPSTAISGTDYQVPLGFSSPLSQSGGTVSCATCVVTGGANTYTGGTNLQDFSGVKLKPPVTIVASLPTAATNTNAIYEVTDGSTASDCTTGSGTNRVWCVSSGSGWVAMGGSAVTGSASPGATVTVTNSATPTFTCPSSTSGTTVLFKMASTLAATITSSTLSGCTGSSSLSSILNFVFTQASSGGPYTVAMPTGFSQACQISPIASADTNMSFSWDGTTAHLLSCSASTGPGVSPETAAPGTPPAGYQYTWADSTDHDREAKDSSANVYKMVKTGVDINPVTGQVTASHLASALPRAQGGTNNTAGNTPQLFFGTAAPGSVTGNLPGDLFSDTTNHNLYQCNATSGTSAPACTSVTSGGWTLLNSSTGVTLTAPYLYPVPMSTNGGTTTAPQNGAVVTVMVTFPTAVQMGKIVIGDGKGSGNAYASWAVYPITGCPSACSGAALATGTATAMSGGANNSYPISYTFAPGSYLLAYTSNDSVSSANYNISNNNFSTSIAGSVTMPLFATAANGATWSGNALSSGGWPATLGALTAKANNPVLAITY